MSSGWCSLRLLVTLSCFVTVETGINFDLVSLDLERTQSSRKENRRRHSKIQICIIWSMKELF